MKILNWNSIAFLQAEVIRSVINDEDIIKLPPIQKDIEILNNTLSNGEYLTIVTV
jgi:hypothetical protein